MGIINPGVIIEIELESLYVAFYDEKGDTIPIGDEEKWSLLSVLQDQEETYKELRCVRLVAFLAAINGLGSVCVQGDNIKMRYEFIEKSEM